MSDAEEPSTDEMAIGLLLFHAQEAEVDTSRVPTETLQGALEALRETMTEPQRRFVHRGVSGILVETIKLAEGRRAAVASLARFDRLLAHVNDVLGRGEARP